MDAANAVPIIGTPMAYGLGFGVLVLVVLTGSWASSLVTVAHEGGHIVVGILTLRGPKGFAIGDNGDGVTGFERGHWSISWILTAFAGYAFPPLLGLGGAFLIKAGNAGGALVISIVLLVAAFVQARNTLANLVTLLVVIGMGWALFAASATVKVGIAVAVVWWMLIGGAYDGLTGLSGTSDGAVMARSTLIPRIVWQLAWLAIGVVCLWKGGRALLAF